MSRPPHPPRSRPRPTRLVPLALGPALALLVAGAAAAAPTLGFVETFPGVSLQDWGGGAALTNPGTGGTGGADDPLEIHVSIGIPFTNFWQFNGAFLPPHGQWAEFVADLSSPANWTQIIGTGTFAQALQAPGRWDGPGTAATRRAAPRRRATTACARPAARAG